MSDDEHKMPGGAEGGLPAKLAPKEQPKKLPNSASPEESSEIQQLVNTLSLLCSYLCFEAEYGGVYGNGIQEERTSTVYAAGQNFKTWVSHFLQYANLVHIKPSGRRAYLQTLLEQPAYKAVELLKLSESLTFAEFTAKLHGRKILFGQDKGRL